MSIRKKILLIAIAPVLILGILSIIFTFTIMKNTMMNEIEEALRGTAAATLAAYDQNTGDYLKASNGDICKHALPGRLRQPCPRVPRRSSP